MSVFYSTDNLPEFHHAVVTIGTFDGVHLGHQKILKTVIDQARALQGESIVITFHPHPRKLLLPQQDIKILTPLEDKIAKLTELGIDHVIVIPFTKAFASLSAEEYIQDFLVAKCHPQTIVIGYDHHFGSDRKGNIHLLKAVQDKYHFNLIEIPEQLIDEAGISSTKIRKALLAGDVAEARNMMGRYYSLKGRVIKGRQLGRTIGYPTANIHVADSEQLMPGVGIYSVWVKYGSDTYGGMLSIGYNPTVTEDTSMKMEVHIFDFNKEIYDEPLEVQWVQYLRPEYKFDSLEALKKQLQADEIRAKQSLKEQRS